MAGPRHDLGRVVVVGAGLGGWRTATELRRLGHPGPVTVLGAEMHPPYDRPPLSKRVLAGTVEPATVHLDDVSEAAASGIELVSGVRATAVRPGRLETAVGALDWDTLVLATGGEPRRPTFVPEHPRVHVLRTLDHAVALRRDLLEADSLVVVGGGFIGMEVAATARSLGVSVTLLEAAPALGHLAVGSEVGDLLAALHRAHGVDVRVGVRVVGIDASASGVEVATADGSTTSADIALVGLGIVPGTQLLDGLGLDLDDGVRCDGSGRVSGLEGVWAVGDVARWATPEGGSLRREHWSTTADQASIVAHAALRLEVPDHLRAPPYVWSDQYQVKVQLLGRPDLADDAAWVERESAAGVYGWTRGPDLVAVATVGPPRLLAPHRKSVALALDGLRPGPTQPSLLG